MTPDLAHRWDGTRAGPVCLDCGGDFTRVAAVCPARLAAWEASVREDAARAAVAAERERIAVAMRGLAHAARLLAIDDGESDMLDDVAAMLLADTLGREAVAQGGDDGA